MKTALVEHEYRLVTLDCSQLLGNHYKREGVDLLGYWQNRLDRLMREELPTARLLGSGSARAVAQPRV
jgi:hypothetical protein